MTKRLPARPLRGPTSLQARLIIGLLALLLLVGGLTAWKTWREMRHELDELLDGHLAQAAALLVAQQLREIEDRADHEDQDEKDRDKERERDARHGEAARSLSVAAPPAPPAHDLPPALEVPSPHRYAPKVAFQIFHDGELILRSALAPQQPMAAADAEPGDFSTVDIGGKRWRIFTATGSEHDVRVHVGERIDSRDEIAFGALSGMVWPTLMGLPLLALLIGWAVHRATAPLREAGRLLATRSPQDLAALDLPQAPAEMQPMLAELNRLFARITELMESERRFTADAAHELRTPIAAIRTQAQVALKEPDEGLRRHALHATLAGCDRATRVVEQLLTLSRLEAGAQPPMQAVDLRTLARQLVAELAIPALQKGQQIELILPEAADDRSQDPTAWSVPADVTLLGLLLRNLLDNAIRYCPVGATVQVSLAQAAAGGLVLGVEDSGPGLAEADLARLGERFFRVLGSGASGSGLGWSIVRRIAAVHGIEMLVQRSARLGGLAVALHWPAA